MLPSSRLLLSLALVLSSAALASGPADPAADLARAEAKQALDLASSPRAAAHLFRLRALEDQVEDLTPIAQAYEGVLGRRRADPLARATARMLLFNLERARGHVNRSGDYVKELGFVQDFYAVGGFDNEGKSGCNTDFGPEEKLDLDAAFPLRGHEVRWQKLPVRSASGYVDLGAAIRPNTESVAYALTFLQAAQDSRVTLGVGTSGAFRLFVNGQLAASSDRYNAPHVDQARVSVKLPKGTSRVLLKVCEDSGALGFFLRQEGDRAGQVQVALPDKLPEAPKGAIGAQPMPTLTEALAAEVSKHPDDAQLRGEYATVLDTLRAFDSKDHAATAEAERAAALAPKDVQLQLLAADLQREDHNLRRAHVDQALAASAQDPAARLALAELELSRDHADRALPILEALSREYPGYAEARALLAQAHEQLQELPAAAQGIDAALRELPRAPQVIRAAARFSRRLERAQEATERMRVALAVRYDDVATRHGLATLLADLGRPQEAARELEVLSALDPFDNPVRLELADLLASNGRLPEAEALYAVARQLSPYEPEVHEREARALLQAGHKEEAIAAFERSLQLRPQNPALKEALRSLKGDDSGRGTEYLVDVAPLLAEADSFAGEDAVYLVDNSYIRVQQTGLSSRLQQMAVKVYSQRGVDAFRSFPITYSPNRQEVRVLRARITKPDGSIVDSYGDNDRAMNEPWSGMYYDARAKVLSFPSLAPGDLLEIRYRVEDTAQENLLSDYWGDVDYLQGTAPKVRYQFLVDMPQSRPLYWNKSTLGAGIQQQQTPLPEGRTLYRWSAKNVSRIVPEPNMPGWAEVATTLHVSTYKTWEDVGRYYWGLIRDQLVPNDELRHTVDQVLAGVDRKDQLAVVRAVFAFVVTNTRYVALEFGIHGYKPYRVDRVLARRFGDCKDKASLMHAMLEVAGVDSRLVLLRMRNLGSIGGEPASLAAFNHAIVYVPKFDLYLDGTAEFHGAGEMPSADRVANVLIVEPDARSEFLTTPEAKADDNLTELGLDVALRPDGSAELQGSSKVAGDGASSYRRAYRAANTRKAQFEQAWAQSFPGLTVNELRVSDLGRLDDAVSLQFKMSVPRYAEALPQGLRFHPFGSGRSFTQSLAPLSERHFDLVFDEPWVNRFHFTYALPQGWRAADLFAPVKDETPFGHLAMECKQDGAALTCDAELAITAARIRAADYPAFRAFIGRVDQAFSRKLVVTAPAPAQQAGSAPASPLARQ